MIEQKNTTLEELEKRERDDYDELAAQLRGELYRSSQRREAQIRAEKTKGKAAGFLNALTQVADAFTLGRGGDIPQRDYSRYTDAPMARAQQLQDANDAEQSQWRKSLIDLSAKSSEYRRKLMQIKEQRGYEDRLRDLAIQDKERTQQWQAEQQEKLLALQQNHDFMIRDADAENKRQQIEQQGNIQKELAQIAGDYRTDVARISQAGQTGRAVLRINNSTLNNKGAGKKQEPITVYNNSNKPVTIDWNTIVGIFGLLSKNADLTVETTNKYGLPVNVPMVDIAKNPKEDQIRAAVLTLYQESPDSFWQYYNGLNKANAVTDAAAANMVGAAGYNGEKDRLPFGQRSALGAPQTPQTGNSDVDVYVPQKKKVNFNNLYDRK